MANARNLGRIAKEFAAGPGIRSVWIQVLGDVQPPVAVLPGTVMPAGSLLKVVLVDTLLAQTSPEQLGRPAVRASDLERSSYPSITSAFEPSRALSLREVAAFTILTSDNPCSNFLVHYLGWDVIHAHIDELGLLQTSFRVGFTDKELGATGRQNATSASDMARLFLRLWNSREDDRLGLLWSWLTNNLRNFRIPARLPDDILVAHKTGTLEGVVNDAGIIQGHPPILLCVLMDNQPDTVNAAVDLGWLAARIVTEASLS